MILPTVGRVVHFYDEKGDGPFAAIVAYVHGPRMVNLTVLDWSGVPKACTSVPLCQPGDPRPEGMHCAWMAYQLGQAARTEQAEAKLSQA